MTHIKNPNLKINNTFKNPNEIVNSFEYGFSNGPVEGINNKIKVISRIAYGFRNFENFRQRILISFKNSYFAINYKKTTNPNYELVA
ncbi:transposase [Periweissella beninensis]|uniref:Transposase n=1 Tax=Periweissella beninensis TaxID=504936 RepID=A0ABT0VIX6_9LACO|nr:transposase [Periweissella beninensis]